MAGGPKSSSSEIQWRDCECRRALPAGQRVQGVEAGGFLSQCQVDSPFRFPKTSSLAPWPSERFLGNTSGLWLILWEMSAWNDVIHIQKVCPGLFLQELIGCSGNVSGVCLGFPHFCLSAQLWFWSVSWGPQLIFLPSWGRSVRWTHPFPGALILGGSNLASTLCSATGILTGPEHIFSSSVWVIRPVPFLQNWPTVRNKECLALRPEVSISIGEAIKHTGWTHPWTQHWSWTSLSGAPQKPQHGGHPAKLHRTHWSRNKGSWVLTKPNGNFCHRGFLRKEH